MAEERSKSNKDIKVFSDELKRCFSKDEIEEIARETGFVKRKGKIKAYEFVISTFFLNKF